MKWTVLLLLAAIVVCPVTVTQAADDVYESGYDRWFFGATHLSAFEVETLDPGFTPSFLWVDADSLDIRVQCKAVGDTTLAPVANILPIGDGEGMTLPLRVDYVVIRSTGDAGRVRYMFGGHSQ